MKILLHKNVYGISRDIAALIYQTVTPGDEYMRQWTRSFIGADNGLSPAHSRAVIWSNANLSSIGPPGTNCSEMWIDNLKQLLTKCIWKCL